MTDLPAESVEAPDAGLADEPVEESVEDSDASSDAERREALLEDTPEEAAARAPGRVETGNPAVDEVIASLEGLDGVPVDEHVALFEQAHEQLRRTLSGAGENPA